MGTRSAPRRRHGRVNRRHHTVPLVPIQLAPTASTLLRPHPWSSVSRLGFACTSAFAVLHCTVYSSARPVPNARQNVHAVQLACRRVHALSTTVNAAAHVAVSGSLIRAKAPAYSIQPSASLLARLHTNKRTRAIYRLRLGSPIKRVRSVLAFSCIRQSIQYSFKPFQFWLFSLRCILFLCRGGSAALCGRAVDGKRERESYARLAGLLSVMDMCHEVSQVMRECLCHAELSRRCDIQKLVADPAHVAA